MGGWGFHWGIKCYIVQVEFLVFEAFDHYFFGYNISAATNFQRHLFRDQLVGGELMGGWGDHWGIKCYIVQDGFFVLKIFGSWMKIFISYNFLATFFRGQ